MRGAERNATARSEGIRDRGNELTNSRRWKGADSGVPIGSWLTSAISERGSGYVHARAPTVPVATVEVSKKEQDLLPDMHAGERETMEAKETRVNGG